MYYAGQCLVAMHAGERADDGGPSRDAVVGGMIEAEGFAIMRAWAMATAKSAQAAPKGRRRGRR